MSDTVYVFVSRKGDGFHASVGVGKARKKASSTSAAHYAASSAAAKWYGTTADKVTVTPCPKGDNPDYASVFEASMLP